MKKLLSIILAVSILLTASAIGASAILESTGEYSPDASVETNRYYFYMPQEWKNEYTDSVGVYWWDGTDACGAIDGTGNNVKWPGYKANKSQEENIFYVDCPTDVPIIVWNNYLDGGTDTEADIYKKAMQATDARVEYYSDGDSDIYDTEFFEYVEKSFYGDKSALGEYADNFFMEVEEGFGMSFNMDNMIYVVDPSKTIENFFGRLVYRGEWYFYYGNREYGNYPVKEDAEKYGTVGTLEFYDPDAPEEIIPTEPTTEPTTQPTTEPVTIPEGESFVYFDVKASGWNNVKTIFCHIWRADGTGLAHSWQSKKEKCVYDVDTGIAYYDLSKLNFPVTKEDGKEFCIIFSANTGTQTYNAIMSGSCIGDTMYCDGLQIENPEDSEKKAMTAVWRNNPDCGPQRRITSTGSIVGTAHADGESDVTMLADYLLMYYMDPYKTELTGQLVKELNVSPEDVMQAVIDRATGDDAEEKIEAIEKILASIDGPAKIFECDLNGDGFTNIIDATMIQKYAVELQAFTATQFKTADLNKDGIVNVVDTTTLQKYLAGIL